MGNRKLERSNSEAGLLEVEVEVQDAPRENALETRLLCELPLLLHQLECDVLIRRPGLEADYAVVWVLRVRQVVLRGLLLVE